MAQDLTTLDRAYEYQAEREHELDHLVRTLEQPQQIIYNRYPRHTIRASSISKPQFSSNIIGR